MTLNTRFDLNLLAVFDAIHASGSVTGAARRLNLTQSAISHALARLRRAFDDPLFVRSGQAMVPTALARAIAGEVRGALAGIDAAMAGAARFDPASSTRLFRIGFRQATETRLFAPLVARATAEAPGVRLASVTFRRRELAAALGRGDLDLALDVPSSATAALNALSLQSDSLVVAARAGHPRVRGGIDLAGYVAEDHVLASVRPTGLGTEDIALAAIGAERRVTVRCQLIAAAWQVVAASDRLLTLPRAEAESLRGDGTMQLLPFPVPVPPRAMQLLWHEGADRDPGNLWLRGLVESLHARS